VSVEALPKDPSFPQIAVAGDPESMREVFQDHLRPLDGKAYQVRDCQIFNVRHQQATRCLLQYTLHLIEPGTGREWVQWVTGSMYTKGHTQRIWEDLRRPDWGRGTPDAPPTFAPLRWIQGKLQRSIPKPGPLDSSPAFVPFFYIPNLDMLVQIFPYDRRLPALPLLMAGPSPELEPLLLARFGPGDWQVERWGTEPVKYLAEQRITLRFTVQARNAATGRSEERCFYAKVYHDEEEGKQTYRVLGELWSTASAGGVNFTVGRPIGYLDDLRTLLQEEVPGTSLWELLRRKDKVAPIVRNVARALASLHLGHTDMPRRRPLREEAVILEKTGKSLQLARPHLRAEIEEIVDGIVAGVDNFEDVPLAPTHGDLHAKHILLDGDRLALLDLDRFAKADPVLDVARLLTGLKNAPFSPHPVRDETAARAFTEEYFAHVPEVWRARLPLHYAGNLLKVAAGDVRKQRPDWPAKADARIGEARDSLAGKIW
jgi:hypothetical protein